MAAIRRAEVTWAGDLTSGSGTIDTVTSGAFAGLVKLNIAKLNRANAPAVAETAKLAPVVAETRA